MPAQNQNFAVWAGNSLKLRIPIKNADGSIPNLGGATVKWALENQAGAIVLQKLNGAGAVIQDPTGTPYVEVTIAAADTVALAPGAYSHEAEITDSSGNVSTVTVGRATVQPSIFA